MLWISDAFHMYICTDLSTYKDGDIPEHVPFLSRHGSPIGGNQFFFPITITVIHKVHMYSGMRVKIKCMKRCMACKDPEHILFAFCVCMCSHQNSNAPNLSPMVDNAITPSGIEVLGSSFYICGSISTYQWCNAPEEWWYNLGFINPATGQTNPKNSLAFNMAQAHTP